MAFFSSVFKQGLFSGKTAIVSGGATGIGNAIAYELLDLGCNVVIASRNADRLLQAESNLSELVPNARKRVAAFQCNIRKEEQVMQLMRNTINTFGRIDFLVNNGGGQFPAPLASLSLKGWNAVVETNLTGNFLMCREVYNQWMKNHGGAIVSITMNNSNGYPYMAHSGAARAGVENLTKSLAVEWAPSGVRVNCVAPGVIYSDTAAQNYADPERFNKAIPMIPQNRLGTVEEISATVCYLLSPAASFITGATVRVDGGHLMNGARVTPIDNMNHKASIPYSWQKEKNEDELEVGHRYN